MADDVKTSRKSEKNKNQKKKSWSQGLKTEFDKIIWTDRQTLVKQTIAVVVISAIVCVLITLVDSGSLEIIQHIIE